MVFRNGIYCEGASMMTKIESSRALRVLAGLIGAGIRSSRSPALHEQEARELGINYFYQLIDLDDFDEGLETLLPRLLDAAQTLGFSGVNITHPCKQIVIPHLQKLSETAEAIGAVNTVTFTEEGRVGHNTDAAGFAESFQRNLPDVPIDNVVLLGAGGAGAAVAHAALMSGVGRLAIVDLDDARALALVDRLSGRFGLGRAVRAENLTHEIARADGLIQATPVGMDSHLGMPLKPELLQRSLWVAEVIYFPLETELLRRSREIGARTMDGGGMAVFQAAEAFRLFTGVNPDPERMLGHFARLAGPDL
jgi:shikimate dehydrogenase